MAEVRHKRTPPPIKTNDGNNELRKMNKTGWRGLHPLAAKRVAFYRRRLIPGDNVH